MKKQFYFETEYSETCYNKEYFQNYMKENNLPEIEVFNAIPERIGGGIFWCKKYKFCGDGTYGVCGESNCNDYVPRNKISGVCKHHSRILYNHGDKITLKL